MLTLCQPLSRDLLLLSENARTASSLGLPASGKSIVHPALALSHGKRPILCSDTGNSCCHHWVSHWLTFCIRNSIFSLKCTFSYISMREDSRWNTLFVRLSFLVCFLYMTWFKNGMHFQIKYIKTEQEDKLQKLLWLCSKELCITLCLFTLFVNPSFWCALILAE